MIITYRRDRILYRVSRFFNFGISLFPGSDRRGSVKRSIDIGPQIAKYLYFCAAFIFSYPLQVSLNTFSNWSIGNALF